MPKADLKTQKIFDESGNFIHYEKVCPHCHKKFQTTSRRAKFCSDSCSKKYRKRLKETRARYDEIKPIERLRVRSHTIAVDLVKLQVEMGIRKWQCDCCGSDQNLQVHHKDKFNFLNNTPANLMLLCNKCHAAEHSRVEAELDEQGILLEEFYEPSMRFMYKKLNKNSKSL